MHDICIEDMLYICYIPLYVYSSIRCFSWTAVDKVCLTICHNVAVSIIMRCQFNLQLFCKEQKYRHVFLRILFLVPLLAVDQMANLTNHSPAQSDHLYLGLRPYCIMRKICLILKCAITSIRN